MSWTQVPPPFERNRRTPWVVPFLLAAVPTITVLRFYGHEVVEQAGCLGILAALAIALRVWPPGLPVFVAGAAAGFIAVTDTLLGRHLVVLGIVPLVFWMIATDASDRPYRWVPDGRLFRPCLVPVVASTALIVAGRSIFLPERLVVAACVLALVVFAVPARVDRVLTPIEHAFRPVVRAVGLVENGLEWLGGAIGRVLGVIVMIPAAVLVVLSWASQRVVRFDPLARSTTGSGTWVRRAGGDPDPALLFSGATAMPGRGRHHGLRRTAAAFLSLLVIAAVLVAISPGVREGVNELSERAGAGTPFQAGCDSPPDAAMDGDPGWPQVLCDTRDYSVNGRFSAVTTYTMADFTSENVNVEGGIRETWRPTCDCPRIRVWMFGGSAAFGWWQRDDMTIASQLAKLAADEGIYLDIELRANPGWVLGQEQRLFSDLSVNEEVPDLAIFYDGGNELQRQRYRNEVGRGADESETVYSEDDVDKLLREGPFPWYAGEQVLPEGRDLGPSLPPGDLAEHAMNRYLRDLELARRSTTAADVESLFVWQPLLVNAGRKAGNDEALPADDWGFYQSMMDVALPMIPSDVLDLSDVLDDVEQPVFRDLFHHNTTASGIIAAAMLDELRPRLSELGGG